VTGIINQQEIMHQNGLVTDWAKFMTTKRKPIYTHSPLDSSFILKCSWYEDCNILMVTFNTGSIWTYYDVPFEVYAGFIKSPSYGKYFNLNIRNSYYSFKVSYFSPEKVFDNV